MSHQQEQPPEIENNVQQPAPQGQNQQPQNQQLQNQQPQNQQPQNQQLQNQQPQNQQPQNQQPQNQQPQNQQLQNQQLQNQQLQNQQPPQGMNQTQNGDFTVAFLNRINSAIANADETAAQQSFFEIIGLINQLMQQITDRQTSSLQALASLHEVVTAAYRSVFKKPQEPNVSVILPEKSIFKPLDPSKRPVLPMWDAQTHFADWLLSYEDRARVIDVPELLMVTYFADFLHSKAKELWLPTAAQFRNSPWTTVKKQAISLFYPSDERLKDISTITNLQVDGRMESFSKFNAIVSRLSLTEDEASVRTYYHFFMTKIRITIPHGDHAQAMLAWFTAYDF